MARRPCATRSPRRSRPSLTSCVDRSPGTKALRCHSTLNCGLTLAWLCTSVNLTARGSVAATRTPTACYVSTSRRAQISPDTPPTISLLSLPTSTAALARPSDGRPPPRRSTSIYYRFNQPALRRPLESARESTATRAHIVARAHQTRRTTAAKDYRARRAAGRNERWDLRRGRHRRRTPRADGRTRPFVHRQPDALLTVRTRQASSSASVRPAQRQASTGPANKGSVVGRIRRNSLALAQGSAPVDAAQTPHDRRVFCGDAACALLEGLFGCHACADPTSDLVGRYSRPVPERPDLFGLFAGFL